MLDAELPGVNTQRGWFLLFIPALCILLDVQPGMAIVGVFCRPQLPAIKRR
jgi:hypothetical protein